MSREACKAAICATATVLTVAADAVGQPTFTPPRSDWEDEVLALVDDTNDKMRALLAEVTDATVALNPDLDTGQAG